jgi:hypothetical protein
VRCVFSWTEKFRDQGGETAVEDDKGGKLMKRDESDALARDDS